MSEQKAKGSKQHNLRRSQKNKEKGTFKKQELRTAKNKEKHIKMNKKQGDPLAGVSRLNENKKKRR